MWIPSPVWFRCWKLLWTLTPLGDSSGPSHWKNPLVRSLSFATDLALLQPDSYTHSSVFQLPCRAKHWPSSYCFAPNDHQVAGIFLVLLQPIRRALSKRAYFRRCFCLHPPIWQQTILSDSEVSQYLGAGKAAFVCGSCTCRLNRFDTIRRKYEAVKEDLEAQKKFWHSGGHRHRLSHSHAHKSVMW